MIRAQITKHITDTINISKYKDKSKPEMEALIFKRPTGVRLSYQGSQMLSAVADNYVFEHDDDFLAKHIMALSALQYPWYLSKKYFILFGSEDAMMLKLHQSDVKQFLSKSNLFR